jgi:hypothetical protein
MFSWDPKAPFTRLETKQDMASDEAMLAVISITLFVAKHRLPSNREFNLPLVGMPPAIS